MLSRIINILRLYLILWFKLDLDFVRFPRFQQVKGRLFMLMGAVYCKFAMLNLANSRFNSTDQINYVCLIFFVSEKGEEGTKTTIQTFFTWIWTYDAHTLNPFSVALLTRRTYLSWTIFLHYGEVHKPFFSLPIGTALLYYPAKNHPLGTRICSEWLVSQRLSIIPALSTKLQTHNSVYFTCTQLQTKQKLP